MNRIDLIRLSFRNLLRRRTRSILAIIGVVVGTSAIIVMLSLGFGLSENFRQQIESYGNLHIIDVMGNGGYYPGMGKPGMDQETSGTLDDLAVAQFQKMKHVETVSPVLQEYLKFAIGKYIAGANVMGIDPDFMAKADYDIQDGRLLLKDDKFSVVFGNQVPIWFYNPKKTLYSSWSGEAQVDVLTNKLLMTGDMNYGEKNPYVEPGEPVNYKLYKAKGIGILANPNDESAYNVYMNIDTLRTIKADLKKARHETTAGTQAYDLVKVYVTDINKVQDVSEAIREMGFQTNSLSDWLKAMQDTARIIQGILGGIGAISLLVAALGITNTMIMSIYERTREIGIMKVMGANLTDIRSLFLLEAGLIGFIGGVVGIVFSFVISLLMNTLLSGIMQGLLGNIGGYGTTISLIPWWLVIASLAFSTLIGVVSGYYPARRAMRMSALESIRNE